MATIHESSRDQSAQSAVQSGAAEDSAGDAAPGWEFIAAQMRDGLCWLSTAGELLRINASTTRITGYALAECRRHPHFPADLVIDEDRPGFNQFVVRTQQGREGAELVVRIRRSDAAVIWVSILWQPIFSRSDKHLGTLISIRETEVDRDHAYLLELRKTASRVMHHSAEITHEFDKVCALVTSSASAALRVRRAGVWMFDRDMNHLQCMDLFDAETAQHVVAARIPVSAFPRYMAAISTDQLVVATDACNDPLTAELAESYLRPLGIASMLDSPIVLGGKTIGVLCLEHVGSIRYWATGELAFAEALADFVALSMETAERFKLEELTIRLASIIDATPDLVSTVDTNGDPLYVNPAGRKLLGIQSAQALSEFNVREAYDDEHWQRREQEIIPHVLTRGIWTGETELLSHRGERIPVWQSTIAHRNARGDIEFISSINRDLREQKRNERELQERGSALQKLNNELEQRVRERTERLEELNANLETFAFSVSHDLKAPLRGIEGYSRLLVEEYGSKLSGEALQFLDNIRGATESMSTLIDDLLEYSRVGRRELKRTRFSLRQLVSRVLDGFRHELLERDIRVENTIDDIWLEADLECLLQIIRNLVDNAIKFTRQQTQPTMAIHSEITAGKLVLAVRDNGCGFDMKYHDRIFTIFQRLHRADAYPGTGVGLAIVAKAAERLHGRIWAQSEPGAGSEFYLELPYER